MFVWLLRLNGNASYTAVAQSTNWMICSSFFRQLPRCLPVWIHPGKPRGYCSRARCVCASKTFVLISLRVDCERGQSWLVHAGFNSSTLQLWWWIEWLCSCFVCIIIVIISSHMNDNFVLTTEKLQTSSIDYKHQRVIAGKQAWLPRSWWTGTLVRLIASSFFLFAVVICQHLWLLSLW